MIPVPLYEGDTIIRTVEFVDNLTLPSSEFKLSENRCRVGLKRLRKGRYEGMLVLMYYDDAYPTSSHAEFIGEQEAYELCLDRGRASVIEEYDIKPLYDEGEVEVL